LFLDFQPRGRFFGGFETQDETMIGQFLNHEVPDHVSIEEAILACRTANVKRGMFAAFFTQM
jgi:hypothetical protein